MSLVHDLHITIIYFQPEVQCMDVATCVVGAKEPDPPPPHISHLIIMYFTFNSTFCPITHQHILTIPTLPLALTMDMPHHQVSHHVTESHCIHWLTSSPDVLNLTVEGCWMYWHSIGIHVDVDDFPAISFILI